jgi:hypothetical protein
VKLSQRATSQTTGFAELTWRRQRGQLKPLDLNRIAMVPTQLGAIVGAIEIDPFAEILVPLVSCEEILLASVEAHADIAR